MRRFERPVVGLLVRLVRDPALAEDLAQETFVKAFRRLERYDPSRKLASWLFKIAHNTALDHLRRARLQTVPLEPAEPQGRGVGEVLPAPETEAPDRRAVAAALGGAVEAALGELRPEHREALVLRFQEGLSYQEIAEVTGLALGTVKIHLHRGRKELAAALERRGWKPPERYRGP